MEKLTYNVQEVADILGISKSLVYHMIKEGRIPVMQFGKRRVIPKLALERWMEENVNRVVKESLV